MHNKAFTLAEVLITLTIIGVIAAITIPNIINNSQEKSYRVTWKKAYADFANAATRMASDYNVDTFEEVIDAYAINNGLNKDNNDDRQTVGLELFKKYFKVTHFATDSSRGFFCGAAPFFPNRSRYKYLNGREIGSDWQSPTLFNYASNVCFKTQSYTFDVSTPKGSWGGRVTIKVSPHKTLGVVGKDMFFIDMRNLRKILPIGAKASNYGPDYECNTTAGHGGFACSAKYLYEK